MSYELSEIRALLKRLDGEPADAIEGQEVECLSWETDSSARKRRIREIREEIVALANARGGIVLLGVLDQKRTKADALQDLTGVDLNDLKRSIYDGTEPHILVEIEELIEDGKRILVIRIPRGMPPHTTSEGVAKIRVGKDAKPLVGSDLARLLVSSGAADLTAETLPTATIADIDPEEIQRLRKIMTFEAARQNRTQLTQIAALTNEELLEALNLVVPTGVTLAAILLLGKSHAIARWAPQHEVIFQRFVSATRYDIRHDLKGPILAVIETLEQLFTVHSKMTLVADDSFQQLSFPDLTWVAGREAILNALLHRDYFVRQSTYISLYDDRIEVTSPGGFPADVSPTNILRHPSVRRNPRLADMFQAVGWVNRSGIGVDTVFEELLKTGKAIPRYEATESYVRLILPTRTHEPFARFVFEEARGGRRLVLDDLMVLRTLVTVGELNRWQAAELVQMDEERAADLLVSLRERGYLTSRGRGAGTAYCLIRQFSDRLRGKAATNLDFPPALDAVRLRIQTVLKERGRLSSSEIRQITGLSRTEVYRLMKAMETDGLVKGGGHGRGAFYQPSPVTPARKAGKKR